MKRLLLLLLTLLCVTTLSAQMNPRRVIGIHAGVTLANLGINDGDVQVGIGPKAGFQLGTSFEFLISKRTATYFETGMYFTQKGAKMNEYGSSMQINQSQILIPAMITYYAGRKKIFSVFGGFYYSIGVGGVSTLSLPGTGSVDVDTYGRDSQFNKSEFGLRIGLGLDFGALCFRLGTEAGLTRVVDQSVFSEVGNLKSSAMTLTLGYKF